MKDDSPVTLNGAERRTFKSIGKCIYCESTENLTDEHIIPYGLGGNYVFQKSSCKACAKETGRVEQRVLRGMFWPIRLRVNLQSRSQRPNALRAKVIDKLGVEKFIEVPTKDYPDHLFMMNFRPPGILEGKTPQPLFHGKVWGFNLGGDAEMAERVKKLGVDKFEGKLFPQGDFCRMLAKIAHSHAMGDDTLEPFTPLLNDLVLGRYETPAHLIGCLTEPPDPEPNITHRIGSQIGIITQNGEVIERLLIYKIRLFANFGTPEYHIVTGRLSPNTVK